MCGVCLGYFEMRKMRACSCIKSRWGGQGVELEERVVDTGWGMQDSPSRTLPAHLSQAPATFQALVSLLWAWAPMAWRGGLGGARVSRGCPTGSGRQLQGLLATWWRPGTGTPRALRWQPRGTAMPGAQGVEGALCDLGTRRGWQDTPSRESSWGALSLCLFCCRL